MNLKNMAKYELRAIDLSDKKNAEELFTFISLNYTKTAHPLTLKSFYLSKNLYFKVYFEEDWIGVCGIDIKTPTLAETIKTVVDNKYQGKGHGRIISNLVEQKCIELGIKKIISTIYTYNVAMVIIKLKQGYVIEALFKDHEAKGFDEYQMYKFV